MYDTNCLLFLPKSSDTKFLDTDRQRVSSRGRQSDVNRFDIDRSIHPPISDPTETLLINRQPNSLWPGVTCCRILYVAQILSRLIGAPFAKSILRSRPFIHFSSQSVSQSDSQSVESVSQLVSQSVVR